jgi:hypothetical protein
MSLLTYAVHSPKTTFVTVAKINIFLRNKEENNILSSICHETYNIQVYQYTPQLPFNLSD